MPPATSVAPSSIPLWISAWVFSNADKETTGPIAKSPLGSPTVIREAASPATPMASSMRALGTSMREGALKVKPLSTSIAVVRCPAPSPTWKPWASAVGAPISSVSAAARSPARLEYSSRRHWTTSSHWPPM